jgi:hypothetical protein
MEEMILDLAPDVYSVKKAESIMHNIDHTATSSAHS